MKRYPAYKDSGVEWFPEIPKHWDVWKLAHAVPLISSGTTPSTTQDEYYADGDIHWVNTGDLNDGILLDCAKRVTALAVEQHSPLRIYPSGSIVLALYGATIGKLGILGFFACVNQACCVMSCTGSADASFLFYWLLGFRERIIALASGGGQPNISQEIVRSLRLPLPPLPEQQAIAGFLDREVGKIDGLVQEQRRLITLLAEKRQAVISHAVTRGLNPATPLKPSGIDWLGDIPEGWEVVPLKYLASGIKAGPFGSSLTKDMYTKSGYRVYGQEQVIPDDFSVGDYFISPEQFVEMQQYEVLPDDILISCVGTFGKIAVAPLDVAPGIINPRLLRLRCGDRMNPEYMATVLRSNMVFQQFERLSRGGTMDVINIGTLEEIELPVPSLVEQAAIIALNKAQTAQLDALTTAATSAIALLQERRAALISAAVTGKIDLRDISSPSLSEPEHA